MLVSAEIRDRVWPLLDALDRQCQDRLDYPGLAQELPDRFRIFDTQDES